MNILRYLGDETPVSTWNGLHLGFRHTLHTQPTGRCTVFLVCLCFHYTRTARCGIFHMWGHVGAQRASEFGTFWILGFWIRAARPALSNWGSSCLRVSQPALAACSENTQASLRSHSTQSTAAVCLNLPAEPGPLHPPLQVPRGQRAAQGLPAHTSLPRWPR